MSGYITRNYGHGWLGVSFFRLMLGKELTGGSKLQLNFYSYSHAAKYLLNHMHRPMHSTASTNFGRLAYESL